MKEPIEEPIDDTTLAGRSPERASTLRSASSNIERRIGPYRLLKELGHGGMGTVFLAVRADEQFEKRVALKVVRGSDSEEVIRFFRRERQILAGLEHPNIARLLDGGTTDDGLPYFVMEHVEGEPIDRYCDARKLSIPERLELFEGACSAVQYAHQSLVVHRDLKPGNILVTGEGIPKLLDFGIAKLLNPGVAGVGSGETIVAMTPEYASPEQVRGRALTTATDIYSLGVILYELLTGQRPYRVKSTAHIEVLKAVCEEEPQRPSTAVGRTGERRQPDGTTVSTTPEEMGRLRDDSPQRLKKRLQGDLDAIVLAALQKEPTQRYASVEALSADIRRYLDGRPITARKAGRIYRVGKYVGRHKLGVAAAATIAVLLTTMAVISMLQASRVRKERDRATAETAKATAMNLFLQDALGAADPWAKGSRNISLLDALRQAQSKAESAFQDQPLIAAAVLQTIGTTFASLAEFTEAEKALRSSYHRRVAAAGPRSLEAADSLQGLSNLYVQWHRYDEAAKAAREALEITREHYGPKSLETAGAMSPLGVALQRQTQVKELKALAGDMLAIARARNWPDPRQGSSAVFPAKIETDALGFLSGAALEEQDFKQMEALDRERLGKLRDRYPDRSPEIASALNDLGTAQMMNGDLAGAEATYRKVLEINTALFGADHPEVALVRENLGNVFYRSGKYDETTRMLEAVLAVRRKSLGDDSEAVARTRANMGSVLKKAGNRTEAVRSYRAALETLARTLGPDHLDVAAVRAYLGDTLRLEGQLDEADSLFRQSLEVRSKVLGEKNPLTQTTLRSLAELSTARGKPDEAAAYRARLLPPPGK
ncbi:MAG: tetratricopeptide repeat protein [Myxococcaceae bacterium]